MSLLNTYPLSAFFLAALATWRLTHLLNSEDGPFDLVYILRSRLGDSFFGHLMDCFYCLSIWISVPMAFMLADSFVEGFILLLSLSAAAIFMERLHILLLLKEQAPLVPPQFNESKQDRTEPNSTQESAYDLLRK